MIPHDPASPLLFIHVPKTAGNSVRKVFSSWFGDGLIWHYFNNQTGRAPERDPRFDTHSSECPVCVFGHFNRQRGFGVEDNYPDASQCVTILRDPFEVEISKYWFLRRIAPQLQDRSQIPEGSLADYLATARSSMLDHFPREVTMENHRAILEEFFVDIGFVEDLAASLSRMAARLGQKFDPADLEHLNATPRDDATAQIQPMRDLFRERNALVFAVHDHARAHFALTGPSNHGETR